MEGEASRSDDTLEVLSALGLELGALAPLEALTRLEREDWQDDSTAWDYFAAPNGTNVAVEGGTVVTMLSDKSFVVEGVELCGLTVDAVERTLREHGPPEDQVVDVDSGLDFHFRQYRGGLFLISFDSSVVDTVHACWVDQKERK